MGPSAGGCFSTDADRHNSVGFVFQPQAWTFKETEQWRALRQGNFPPDFSKHTSHSAHTPTLFCKYTLSCARAAALVCCSGQWTVFSVVKEASGESVEKLHAGKHKSKSCCFGLSLRSFPLRQQTLATTLCALVFPQELLVLVDYSHTHTQQCLTQTFRHS